MSTIVLEAVDLSKNLWKHFRTVLVYGNVSKAVWWPPVGKCPGVLAAGSEDQAREAYGKLKQLEALLTGRRRRPTRRAGGPSPGEALELLGNIETA